MKEGGDDNLETGATEHRLFLGYLTILLLVGALTVGQIGITWDEPNYFTSSYSYLSWFGHVAAEPSDWWASIDHFWEQSHEAPPFFKLWAGLFAGGAALVFGTEDLALLGDAYRMGSYALFLLSTYAAFRFLRSEFGVAAAWGAALSMPLIPPLFGFARLGQLDGAVASMYLLAALAMHRMLTRGGGWRTVGAGSLLGWHSRPSLTSSRWSPRLSCGLRSTVAGRLCGSSLALASGWWFSSGSGPGSGVTLSGGRGSI